MDNQAFEAAIQAVLSAREFCESERQAAADSLYESGVEFDRRDVADVVYEAMLRMDYRHVRVRAAVH